MGDIGSVALTVHDVDDMEATLHEEGSLRSAKVTSERRNGVANFSLVQGSCFCLCKLCIILKKKSIDDLYNGSKALLFVVFKQFFDIFETYAKCQHCQTITSTKHF